MLASLPVPWIHIQKCMGEIWGPLVDNFAVMARDVTALTHTACR